MSLDRDGDGFLLDMGVWSIAVMHEMASEDGVDMTEEKIMYILKARDMYEVDQMVPRIREFAKALGMDRKAKPLYEAFESGPMKQIAKYGGLPKPTGCV